MTERERKILMGESIEPRTADENAYANVSGGGGGGVLVCHLGPQTGALDRTWQEIHDADFSVVKFENPNEEGTITWYTVRGVEADGNGFYAHLVDVNNLEAKLITLSSDSANGYPAATGG